MFTRCRQGLVLALMCVVLLGASNGCREHQPANSDPRAHEGSRSISLEGALADYDLRLPSCALNQVQFWDAPEDWGRNLIIRSEVAAECREEILDILGVPELLHGSSLPYWALGPTKSPDDGLVYFKTVILPETSRRGDMQLNVAMEEGTPGVVHLRFGYS